MWRGGGEFAVGARVAESGTGRVLDSASELIKFGRETIA